MRSLRRGSWAGAVLATGALAAVTIRDGSLEATGPLLSVLGFFVSLAGLLLNTVGPTAAALAEEQLGRSADALATAVRMQWQEEWRLRRLQDPEPLAVRWAPAQAWLSDLDDAIGRPPRDAERPDLDGRLPEIAQVFGYVPSRRLVVLGAPGSGKTVLAVRFTLDLLEHRGADDPVPVIFQASTWQPPAAFRTSTRWDSEDAVRWLRFLARHLERRASRDVAWWELHRALPTVSRTVGPLLLLGMVAELVCLFVWLATEADVVILVAVPSVVLGLCAGYLALSRDGLGPVRRLLLALACVVPLGAVVGGFRPLTEDPYNAAPFVGMNQALAGLSVGALYGVCVATALSVIGISAGPTPATMPFPVLRSRRYGRWAWKAVGALVAGGFTYLFANEWLLYGDAVWILVAIGAGVGAYVVRGEGAGAVETGDRPRSRRMRGHARGFGRALAAGLGVGLLAGLAIGLAFALAEGGTAAARAAVRADFPLPGPVQHRSDGGRYVVADDGTRYGLRPDGDRYVILAEPLQGGIWTDPVVADFLTFLMVKSGGGEDPCDMVEPCRRLTAPLELSADTEGYDYVVRLPDGRFAAAYYRDGARAPEHDWLHQRDPDELLRSGLSFGLAVGLGLGIVAGFAAGLHRWLGAPVDIARTPSPQASLRTDRDTGIVRGALITFIGFVAGTVVSGALSEWRYVAALVFLPTGLITLALTAWGRLLTARLWLCAAGRLPWRLMAFLDEAHRRGVLRQAGAVYQFRHARLQERLAAEPEVSRSAGPPVRPASP